MVVLLDLEEGDAHDDPHLGGPSAYDYLKHQLRGPLLRAGNTSDVPASVAASALVVPAEDRPNPNLNGFSAALGCYPIVASLAGHLDLNTLHDLSRTCRQFRANLLQYRKQLIAQSLRCSRENDENRTKLADRLRESQSAWNSRRAYADIRRITSGKVGQCARDKVGECRKCGTIVCRNCIAKPPSNIALKDRHRRLCKTCARAPLELLLDQHAIPEEVEAASATSSSPSTSPARIFRLPTPPLEDTEKHTKAFTAPAFEHTPCNCVDEVWLCQSCGSSRSVSDGHYKRGWVWRAKYSELGVGIGEGDQGVPCGRDAACLASKVEEQEMDCDADALRQMEEEAESSGRSWEGGGFEFQEVEGVGGVVKKKVKKLILVGKKVQEFKDERSGSTQYLSREQRGELRSWCSWCDRVIPSIKGAKPDIA